MKLAGVMVTPTFPFRLGIKSPGGRTISNECAIVAKNKNISIFAKTSPKPRRKLNQNIGLKMNILETNNLIKRKK